jgi:hypothetical protein
LDTVRVVGSGGAGENGRGSSTPLDSHQFLDGRREDDPASTIRRKPRHEDRV